MACNAGPDIIEDGLVLCLDAGNNNSYPKSGTTWSDLVDNNIGTLYNSPAFSNDSRGCFVFDGTNEYAAFSSSDLINTATGASQHRSVCIWAKYTTTSNLVIMEKGVNKHFILQTKNGGGISWRVGNGSASYRAEINNTNDGNWHYFSLIYDGAAKIYLDGVHGATSNSHASDVDDSVDFVIGSRTGSYAFAGSIACVSIYNRALTADEVRQNYEATVGRFT